MDDSDVVGAAGADFVAGGGATQGASEGGGITIAEEAMAIPGLRGGFVDAVDSLFGGEAAQGGGAEIAGDFRFLDIENVFDGGVG